MWIVGDHQEASVIRIIISAFLMFAATGANAQQPLDPVAIQAALSDLREQRNFAMDQEVACRSSAAGAAAKAVTDAKFAKDEIFWLVWWTDHREDKK